MRCPSSTGALTSRRGCRSLAAHGTAWVSVARGRATGEGTFGCATAMEGGEVALAAQAKRWRASVSRLAASTAVRT